MSNQKLPKPDYEALREAIRARCVRARHHAEYMRLMAQAERECSPQQLRGICRIVGRLNNETDDADLYYSQF